MAKKELISQEEERQFLDEIMRQTDAMALGVTPAELKGNDKVEKTKKLQAYETAYIKPTSAVGRQGKMIYLRDDYHKRITAILAAAPKSLPISIFAYVDNVLAEHFEKYMNEIVAYIKEGQKQMFNE